MAPIAEENKVILFSSISTTDDLRKSGEYIFRNVPRNEIQGITAARFLVRKLGKLRIVILKKNDEYGTNLSRSFREEAKNLGGEILLDDAYQPGTGDFRTIIAKIKALDPQAVYIPGNYQEVAAFLKQAYESGLKTTFAGGDGSYSPELTKIAGNAADGSYYTIMAVRHNDYYAHFRKLFVKKYGQDPDVYDAYAYEAASIILQAIKDVGYDASKIRDYLLTHSFDSLTGALKFDKDGEVEREYGIVQVQEQKFVDVN
jgi:branched-chain amino acid transport system substrate-binding protein